MTSRDDYPWYPDDIDMGVGQHNEMLDEIDRLRAEVAAWRHDPGREMMRGITVVKMPQPDDTEPARVPRQPTMPSIVVYEEGNPT